MYFITQVYDKKNPINHCTLYTATIDRLLAKKPGYPLVNPTYNFQGMQKFIENKKQYYTFTLTVE